MTSYTISADGKAITCAECGLTSHNPNDVATRYCGQCKAFHDDGVCEYDCRDCGRHIIVICGPNTGLCAACTAMPGWFRDPDLATRIDPDYEPPVLQ